MNKPLLFVALAAGALAVLIAGRSASERPYASFHIPGRGAVIPGDVPLSLPGVLGATRDHGGAARASVVIDGENGGVLFAENAFISLPIASLTKIMSAMVALDQHPDLRQETTILPTEYSVRGGNLRLMNGERVTLRDLLFTSLTGSANNAAFALPRALGMSDDVFVEEMQRKAVALGIESFRFVDAAGLSSENVGNAYDMARLAAHALAHYPLIAEAMAAPEYRVLVRGTGREHVIRNSNPLLGELGPGTESKTGYLNEALHCLVLTRASGVGRRVAVILGHPDERGVIQEATAALDAAGIIVRGGSPARAEPLD